MTAKTLMVVGSSSSAGKSLLATALCHSFARRGVRVAPFKAQNMSNNAAVCPGGGEIGRAQALQARAAGLEPHVDFNPVLIKPEADAASQVVVLGRPYKRLLAASYYAYKQAMWGYATAALDRLRAKADLVIMEGAGSPVELNLKAGDIVNMPMAAYADAPVLLVGDIDRGGIFAQLLGTLWLLEPDERQRVRGLIVNKFRGDLALFADGVRILEERGGVPVLGVVPYLHDLGLPEEDAVALDMPPALQRAASEGQIDIAVIRLPLISNFDDFDPFRSDQGVRVRFVSSTAALGQPDVICLPGTKSTTSDLAWLRANGLADAIAAYAAHGGAVVGVCGGYQMLGEAILDPDQVESAQAEAAGLGLLPVRTVFADEKETRQTRAQVLGGPAWLGELVGLAVDGYEIHMGRSESRTPWLKIEGAVGTLDGAISPDGRIWGCYLHGIFGSARLRRAWLAGLGWHDSSTSETPADLEERRFTQALTRLTDAVETALDMHKLEAIVWGN
jgi:adenosylcobyric acid synthase